MSDIQEYRILMTKYTLNILLSYYQEGLDMDMDMDDAKAHAWDKYFGGENS